jgi:hypothetical protein
MNFAYALVLCVIIQIGAYDNSLTLFNNSPFTLTATVIAADGTNLGQFTINPQNGAQWTDQYEMAGTSANPNASQTPYTIIWYCPEGTEYGINTQQSPGAYVTSGSAQGNLSCKLQNKPMLVPQQ